MATKNPVAKKAVKKPTAKKVATKKPTAKKLSAKKTVDSLASAVVQVNPSCTEFFVIAFDEEKGGYYQFYQGDALKIFHAVEEAVDDLREGAMKIMIKAISDKINKMKGKK